MRRALVVGVVLAAAVAGPAVAGGAPRASAAANALCLKLRTADGTLFRQIFPGRGGLSLCSDVQAHRTRCSATTTLDANARDRLSFSLGCRGGTLGARAPGVTQFALLVNRTFTALGPVTLGSSIGPAAGFRCGVRQYPGRSTLICINGFVAYGRQVVATDAVAPNVTCNLRGLYAIRTATGAWDIFTLVKAPRVLNGPQCPAPHF
jgi:hypothetical protein